VSRSALTDEPLTVAGDGSQTRSIQYVDDLVDGCLRLLRSTLAGPVNIGNPYEVSIDELAVLIREGERRPWLSPAGRRSARTSTARAADRCT
jgi:nucleoside-diphosphate-sugar epimerase